MAAGGDPSVPLQQDAKQVIKLVPSMGLSTLPPIRAKISTAKIMPPRLLPSSVFLERRTDKC